MNRLDCECVNLCVVDQSLGILDNVNFLKVTATYILIALE